MKFIDFLIESRFDMGSGNDEKKRAHEFMNKYGGNIFTIKSKHFVIEYVWTVHAMSRFIERNRNPSIMQKMLELTNEEFLNFRVGTKYLIKSKSMNQSMVIVKDNNYEHKLSIVTIYPDQDRENSSYKNEYMIEEYEEVILE